MEALRGYGKSTAFLIDTANSASPSHQARKAKGSKGLMAANSGLMYCLVDTVGLHRGAQQKVDCPPHCHEHVSYVHKAQGRRNGALRNNTTHAQVMPAPSSISNVYVLSYQGNGWCASVPNINKTFQMFKKVVSTHNHPPDQDPGQPQSRDQYRPKTSFPRVPPEDTLALPSRPYSLDCTCNLCHS